MKWSRGKGGSGLVCPPPLQKFLRVPWLTGIILLLVPDSCKIVSVKLTTWQYPTGICDKSVYQCKTVIFVTVKAIIILTDLHHSVCLQKVLFKSYFIFFCKFFFLQCVQIVVLVLVKVRTKLTKLG